MLAYWDKDLVCRYANSAYVEWFGKTKDEMINTIRINELLGPLYEKNLPYIRGVLSGKKQLFEREIPIPGGNGVRHSLASYIPDIKSGEVIGFFVHVADVTYLKHLENEIAAEKRETLRKVIETEEAEKRHLVEILRESVNQRLVACKIMEESERKRDMSAGLHEDVSASISEIIQELNILCQEMVPTEIEMLGLIEAIELYLAQTATQHDKKIYLDFADHRIEKIMLNDKYSIFRIVQNYIRPAVDDSDVKNVEVSLTFNEPIMEIKIVTDAKVMLDKSSKEYHAIASRVDNYAGKLTEYSAGSKNIFQVSFPLPKL
jgi:signal transduction histidine kinase